MNNIFQKYKLKRSWNCEKSLRKPHHAFEEAFHEIDVQFFSDTTFCVQSCKITVIWLRRWSVIRQIVYQNVGCSIFRWCLSIYFASSRSPVQICSLRDPSPPLPSPPPTHSAVRILLGWFLVRHFFTDGDQMSVAKGSLYSEVSCLRGGWQGWGSLFSLGPCTGGEAGVPVQQGPMLHG